MVKENQSQLDKFKDLARDVEADEDEAHFEDTVRKIAKAPKPKDEPKAD